MKLMKHMCSQKLGGFADDFGEVKVDFLFAGEEVVDAVAEGEPGGFDDVEGDADGGPGGVAVAGFDEDAGLGGGAAPGIDDADLVVDEFHFGDGGVKAQQRL